jgi:YHS domain-containing protein
MKYFNHLVSGLALAAALIAIPTISRSEGTNSAAATPAKPDLMTTCPVSGEKLGEMGKPYAFVYSNQVVNLCCPMCKPDFDKDPQKFLKKIQDAAKAKN